MRTPLPLEVAALAGLLAPAAEYGRTLPGTLYLRTACSPLGTLWSGRTCGAPFLKHQAAGLACMLHLLVCRVLSSCTHLGVAALAAVFVSRLVAVSKTLPIPPDEADPASKS